VPYLVVAAICATGLIILIIIVNRIVDVIIARILDLLLFSSSSFSCSIVVV
jgi:hypothetical protein